jgi:23S rRNA U2552 (ribose-2'-O)-methylase RlmE/FtsJ
MAQGCAAFNNQTCVAAVAVALQGAGTQEFTKLMQKYFKKVARMRVEASRSMSREFYAIGLGRKEQ